MRDQDWKPPARIWIEGPPYSIDLHGREVGDYQMSDPGGYEPYLAASPLLEAAPEMEAMVRRLAKLALRLYEVMPAEPSTPYQGEDPGKAIEEAWDLIRRVKSESGADEGASDGE